MKPRVYNNYDGYMYTVHNLSLGTLEYKGTSFNLDDEMRRLELLNLLTEDRILEAQKVWNHHYWEFQYRFVSDTLPDIYRKHYLDIIFLQEKATILNFKEIANM